MPQAIEWSFATPMMRPRRPCINPFVITPLNSSIASGRTWPDAKPIVDEIVLWPLGSAVIALQGQRRVGAAEAEAVGDRHIDLHIVAALAHNGDVGKFGIELVDIGALAKDRK